MNDIRLIHLADIHLGYTGPVNFVCGAQEQEHAEGRYVREVDIERAVRAITRAILSLHPPVDVVVIAGDLFHRPAPYPRAMWYAARMVRTLLQQGIEVVLIDGNHETTGVLHVGSPTRVLQELGAHVINEAAYRVICDQDWHVPRLRETKTLAVHALPYRAVQDQAFTGVSPLPEYVNVLLTHGRVVGMDAVNSLGRTVAGIPHQVLRQPWQYVALGDWHLHRYQPLHDVPAYYAGSLEPLNFGEAVTYPFRPNDPYALHGALDIRLSHDHVAVIETLPNPHPRPLLRLVPIDAAEADPETLMAVIRSRFASQPPVEAMVLLEIVNCPLTTWESLPHTEIEQLRTTVRHCEIRLSLKSLEAGQNQDASPQQSLEDQWSHFLDQQVSDEAARFRYQQHGIQQIEMARQSLAASSAFSGKEGGVP